MSNSSGLPTIWVGNSQHRVRMRDVAAWMRRSGADPQLTVKQLVVDACEWYAAELSKRYRDGRPFAREPESRGNWAFRVRPELRRARARHAACARWRCRPATRRLQVG